MTINYRLLVAAIALFAVSIPLERKWVLPNISYGFRTVLLFSKLRQDENAWLDINRFFGQIMYVVSALIAIISFITVTLNVLCLHLDCYLSLLLFISGFIVTFIRTVIYNKRMDC